MYSSDRTSATCERRWILALACSYTLEICFHMYTCKQVTKCNELERFLGAHEECLVEYTTHATKTPPPHPGPMCLAWHAAIHAAGEYFHHMRFRQRDARLRKHAMQCIKSLIKQNRPQTNKLQLAHEIRGMQDRIHKGIPNHTAPLYQHYRKPALQSGRSSIQIISSMTRGSAEHDP